MSPEPKANAPSVLVARICADCLDDKVNDSSSKTWKALHKLDAIRNFGKMCGDSLASRRWAREDRVLRLVKAEQTAGDEALEEVGEEDPL